MRRLLAHLLAALAATGLLTTGVVAGVDPARLYVPGELIVKFKPGVNPAEKAALVPGRQLREFRSIGAEHWNVVAASVESAVAALEADPGVEYAEPNYLLYALEVPNDSRFGELWGLHNTGQTGGAAGADIDAVAAWDLFRGSSSVVVAVIDSGIDYNHPDLAGNVWSNPGEIPGNGIDDDANGFIDDIHGWDFLNGDADPMDDRGHGSHVAGTIGAVGNNGLGVAGVNWDVSLMGLKFLNAAGNGSTADAIASIEYATVMGVDVMSCSWGGGGYDPALEASIQTAYAADIFFVAAAGNDGRDNDVVPHYPSSYTAGNVVAVMATDHHDARAVAPGSWTSNIGATSVDIAAPGLHILSTTPDNTYSDYSGTSMATPYVAGALALLRGRFPDISVGEGKNLLLTIGNDVLPALAGMSATGARLNLHKLIANPDETPPAAVNDLAVAAVASNWVRLQWTAPGDDGLVGTAGSYDARWSTSPILDQADWDLATRATGEPVPSAAGSFETMQIGGLDTQTTYHFSLRARDEYGNVGTLSNSPSTATMAAPTIAVSPASLSATLPPGGAAVKILTITNTGAGVLDFSLPSPEYLVAAKASFAAVPQHEYVALGKGQIDTRAGFPTPTGEGGPDAYGYRWIDSDAVGGPTFNWIEIAGLGTRVTLSDDQNRGPFPIGFTFPFYGNDFTNFRICTNGFISFTATATAPANSALPAAGAPHNLVALYWDDLAASPGDVYYYNDGTRLIVEYSGLDNYYLGGPYTMQLHLYPNGFIEYHYLTMTPDVSSATIGIQNGDGTDGLTFDFNSNYVHDNLAIRIGRTPPWLSLGAGHGSLASLAILNVAVTFDATGLWSGRFDANLHVVSNDPARPSVLVPLTLNVDDDISGFGDPLPRVPALSQNVPNPFNPVTTIRFALPAKGFVKLRIYDVRGALVRTLVTGDLEPGIHEYVWEGRADNGRQVSSGVYFYRLRTAEGDLTRSMTLVK